MSQKVDLTTSTLIRFILILLALWFAYLIRDIFVLFFIVIILVTGLSPTVDRWTRTLTRPGAVISVFLILLVSATVIFSVIVPPLIVQLQEFSFNLPTYAESFSRTQDSTIAQSITDAVRNNLTTLSSQLSNLGTLLFSKTVGVISGIAAVLTIIVLTFYLLLEEEGMRKMYHGLLPSDWHDALAETTRKIGAKLGAWLRGQILLMLAVSVLTTIGLLLIGSPYALTLGLWSGLTEVIPIVGPWLGAVPGVVVGLANSPLQGFLTLVVYVIVQQVENGLLVPRIMSRAVGLNPVIVILSILVGGKLYGILGVLLSVPMAAVISVLAEDWPVIRETFSKSHS